MSNKISILSYTPSSEDKFFVDNNIWMYLFCPLGNYREETVDAYNIFFLKLLQNKCTIYTSTLILSEFFNSYSRVDFNIKKSQNPSRYRDYKRDFRNTDEFNLLSKEICDIIKDKILKYSVRLDDNFSTIDIYSILTEDSNFDFNDKYFAKICEDNNIKILTNDKDFLNLTNNIDIVTN